MKSFVVNKTSEGCLEHAYSHIPAYPKQQAGQFLEPEKNEFI